LLQVESTYEVHDYIKSFLGESDEVHSFAKEFLERRQKLKIFNTSQQHHQQKKVNNNNNTANVAENNSSGPGPSRNSKKKKKANKMQKMSPSDLLGFTVNAAERPNAGEIHSIKDAL
jgi:PERQ amino acid-rich with GYF domain-containing protein